MIDDLRNLETPRPTGPIVRVLEGPAAGTVLDLRELGETTLGGQGSDRIVLPASRGAVCRVRPAGGGQAGFVIEDLTGEGLLVNHKHDTDALLVGGDLVIAGEAVLLYVEDGALAHPHAMAVESGKLTSLNLIEVPRLFHSVYHDGPFKECLVCSRPIDAAMTQYYVEKVFRGSEVILECAICTACMQDMQSEFSEESRERLEAFGRQVGNLARSLVRCDLCGKKRLTLDEFNVICGCVGGWMIQEAVFLICDDCVQRIQELLSKKTREIHGDFLDTHFPGVPHDLDVPSPMLL